ncbi:hypothetical protein [Nocardioides sp. Leaf285]|uniref:hypothetical protein n=1 Tax=Nocardioides sp. Leaf285 TaxID=1736322 RepID=UPI0012EA3052|nr:hypothetical protein [Nocardioides sp. Leaf285]
MGFESGVWLCEICGKQVSRLLGMAGGVQLPGAGAQVRPVVRGYCLSHREAVRQAFREELEAVGEVMWVGEPAVDLRPRKAQAWLQHIDQQLGSAMADGRGFVQSNDGACPHCGADVSWGGGPHVPDAALRPGGVAWECVSCGAAGIAHLLP